MTLSEAHPAVSVVVPVYNPGPFLRPLLDSLDAQSPVDGGFDAIVVDDGSTDGTARALDRWCASRPWARVIHEANSGWASRPRNVGIAESRAEFIQFVDQDDRLTPTALSELVRFARDVEADVVVGRMRGKGRSVPVALFRRTVRDAHAPHVPLPDSMTAHALFRRDFLLRAGLRFDETSRRLEDHLFVGAAYTAARRVAVYADAPVYVHVARSDGGGAGFTPYDPAAYYRDLARAIAIVVQALPPGGERDAYLARWIRIELVGRLRSDAVRWMPAPRRDAFFAAVRDTIRTAMPPDLIGRLPTAWRWPTVLALVASPVEFLNADDAMHLSTAAELRSRSGSDALRGRVSEQTLQRAVAMLGADDPLPAAWSARSARDARLRRARTGALRLVAASDRVHRRLVAWGRTPMLFAREAGAVAVPVLGGAAFLCALGGAETASVALLAGAGMITVPLAVRSTRAGPTAVRELIVLAGCLPGALTAPTWGALALGVALAGVGYAADRVSRRLSVRAHAGANPWRHPGSIAARATAITAVCVAVATGILLGTAAR